MDHTPGHRDCAACRQKAYTAQLELAQEMLYPEAAKLWIESRKFPETLGKVRNKRSRFVSDRSLQDFDQYDRALQRFFRELALKEIHLGHIRVYQEQRANGLLGPTPDELFPKFVKRLAKKFGASVDEIRANPDMLAIVEAQIASYPQREVNPNKVNQEVSMLIRILKLAGLWSADYEENYEPLQHVESDIPQALTREEQDLWLATAQRTNELNYCYSILGIHAVLSTKEERSLKIGDIDFSSGGVVYVRNLSAKNKYRIRTIPLTPEALWAAQRLIERAYSLGCAGPHHYLFPFRHANGVYDPNRPMTVSGIKRPWNDVRSAAGITWFTPYDLRHTGCTRYAEDGISIHVLLSMAGHMSRKMQQHYIHISEAAKKQAVQRTYGPVAAEIPVARKSPVRARGTSVLTLEKKFI